MNTRTDFDMPRRSRWTSVAIAAALLAAAAIGIAALRANTAHAILAADAVAGGRAELSHGTVAATLPDAWRPPASDASVPSAHEVFKAQVPPDFEVAPTF